MVYFKISGSNDHISILCLVYIVLNGQNQAFQQMSFVWPKIIYGACSNILSSFYFISILNRSISPVITIKLYNNPGSEFAISYDSPRFIDIYKNQDKQSAYHRNTSKGRKGGSYTF